MLLPYLFVLVLLFPSYLAVAYYLGLVTARLIGLRDVPPAAGPPRHRFAILIPAHNEAASIAAAVGSCREADYPSSMVRVVVVADNCSDETAERSEQAGAECWRRTDVDQPGKGAALAWAFPRVLAEPIDCVLVMDADCRLDRQTLRTADQFLQAGDRVLQLNHRVTNADASPFSYAAAVGRVLEYDLFFAPKSRLGLAVMLVGTGMVFHRSVLAAIPWESASCAEDTEYTIALTRGAQPIRFVADAHVSCEGVESLDALRIQRTRWARGNIQQGHRQAIRLMFEGLGRGNWRLLDLGWTLLLLSRPLVLLHLACVLLAALGLFVWDRGPTTTVLLALTGCLLALYAIYLGCGVCALGLNAVRLRHLIRTPAVIWQLARIAAAALFGYGANTWIRTPR
jgi:cellulose synthase/poly-beta-1,6-N-acetylglucosamine synthase-like glycosyltransferase